MKILFFHIPSLSMYNYVEPVLVELKKRGHRVIHYNESGFSQYLQNTSIEFAAYKHYQGYFPCAFHTTMNMFDLGLLLLETAEQMVDVVETEILREAPDLILHSKFVAAAKVVAAKYGLPAVCVASGFVFDPRILLEERRQRHLPADMSNVASLLQFRRKAKRFYSKHLNDGVEFEDIFMNGEPLNLVFAFEEFQPAWLSLPIRWNLVGPAPVYINEYSKSYELIYVSLGSVFADNKPFFETCLRALGLLGKKAIISLGGRFSPGDFDNIPGNVELRCFVRQKEVLQKAAVFVTQGGDSSIAEAIYCETPMIVVPQIVEQLFNAQQVERLMIGSCIRPTDLTVPLLYSTLIEMLENRVFRDNVQAFKTRLPNVSSAITACNQIEEFAMARGVLVGK